MCSGWCNNWVTRQHARCNNKNSSVFYSLQLINARTCNYSCTSSWWWVSTAETCRVAYRNVINWISRILLENYWIKFYCCHYRKFWAPVWLYAICRKNSTSINFAIVSFKVTWVPWSGERVEISYSFWDCTSAPQRMRATRNNGK